MPTDKNSPFYSSVTPHDVTSLCEIIFNKSPFPMWVIDAASLQILLVNKCAVKQYGYTKKQFLLMTMHDLHSSENIRSEKYVRVYEQKKNQQQHQLKNQELIDVSIRSYPVTINGRTARLVSAMNITEKKLREQQLNLLESIIRNMVDGIMITKIEGRGKRVIRYINPAYEKMSGYTAAELMGKPPGILHGAYTDKYELERLNLCISSGEPYFGELLNYNKEGKAFWLHFNLLPVKNNKGKVSHVISIARDVTAIKKNEEIKQALAKDLLRTTQDIKQFSFITSHNFRAPLTNMLALIELINQKDLDEGNKRLVNLLKHSAHHLNDIINDLIKILILKETGRVEKTLVNLEEVFERTKRKYKIQLDAIDAVVEIDFKEHWIRFHAGYLSSIFEHLFSNAIKFRRPDVPLVIKASSEKKEGLIKLSFGDNGKGLNPKVIRERLFGLYQHFHIEEEGKGLGLFTVKSLVEGIGASIHAEGNINEGLHFIIEIPSH
ncbi:MAG: pdhS [Chitinophagaceae bacterium]|nr:pdhS [Chitinophagaceae bacterium]